MRPYHSLNQHKHFSKSNMNVLRHYSPRLRKIPNTFHDINNYKDSNNYSCAASIYNETHIFRGQISILIYTEKRKKEKNEIRTIILATQNSMNKKSEC